MEKLVRMIDAYYGYTEPALDNPEEFKKKRLIEFEKRKVHSKLSTSNNLVHLAHKFRNDKLNFPLI